MEGDIILLLSLAAAIALTQPAPSPTPLKTIGSVRASATCGVLREDVGQAIAGILTNDALIEQGRLMLYKVRHDGIAAPLGAGWTGGAGPASALDDVQMNNLVGVLAKNLERIDLLLQKASSKDARLNASRAHLERVADEQRSELNILSGNVRARTGLAPGSESQGPVRLSLTEQLSAEQRVSKQTEIEAALTVKPLIEACR